MEVEEFAKMVGGRIVPENETGEERAKNMLKKPFPMLKTKEDRQKFYLSYIPALYWIEIEGRDPDSLSQGELDLFWHVFVNGIKALGLDKKEGDDMDG